MISAKKIIGIALVIISTAQLQAQIASFSFAGPSTVSGWTNVPGDPHLGVQTATAGGITISSISVANWSPNSNGNCAYDNGGAGSGTYFPAAIMTSSWIQYNGTGNNLALYNTLVPQLALSGLNPNSTYILRMSASNVYFPAATLYTVAGRSLAGSQSLNTYENTSQGVTFEGVTPDSTGTIRVFVNCPSGLSGNNFAWISGLQVFSGSANVGTPQVAISLPANGAILSEGANVIINATATETGGAITKVEFYEDTSKIGEIDTPPYNFTWVGPEPGLYTLTAKATDNVGTINMATVNIGVQSLNYFWSTTGNAGNNPDSNFVGNVDSVRLAFRTKNIERMSISPLGNVGIGVDTPTARLHTTGSVRLAGLTSDSSKTRVLVSDSSGNLYYRNAPTLGLTIGDGLGQTAGGLSLGDSIPGPGPHSFNSNRYQYLNGHLYSIGGSVNDPVKAPAFRIYNNGDLAAGTTMDRSVNTANLTGMRYYSKLGVMQLGASDWLDTTQNKIVYGSWQGSGLLINTDNPNTIKGKLMNTVLAGYWNVLDTLTYMENCLITGASNHVMNPLPSGANLFNCIVGGDGITFSGSAGRSVITGSGHVISKPIDVMSLSGYQNVTMDTARGSIIGGAANLFGGISQLVVGNYLVNRTPFGTTLGNGNVDFSTLSYTGTQTVTNTSAIAQYPLLAIGNSSATNGSIRTNALTMLYNGRTQINTTGYTNALTQTAVTPKAALEVVSTNSGVLLPKLTTAQRNAIAATDLQNGLLLYNTDSSVFQFYNGSAWNSVIGGASSQNYYWSAKGNASTNGDSNFVGTVDNNRLSFRTNNYEHMSISPTGTVTVGTESYTDSLNVQGTISIQDSAIDYPLSIEANSIYSPFVSLSNPNPAVGSTIGTRYYNSSGLVAQFFAGSPSNPFVPNGFAFHDISGGGFDFVSYQPNSFFSWGNAFKNLGGSKMIFYPSTGHLIIGSTVDNGNNLLQVNGNTWTTGLTIPTGATTGYVLTSDAAGKASWQPGSGMAAGHWLFSGGTAYDSLDNIAIGTSNVQGYRLAVNGSAIFTAVKVKPQSNWPDFVFNKEYHLPELKDLEKYIAENKHLPGIISAREVAMNGLDLGDNQSALLKKIEELTLYAIRQDKELEELKQANKSLDVQKEKLEHQQQEIDELKEMVKKLTAHN
jgi:Big-like domain-containing protein